MIMMRMMMMMIMMVMVMMMMVMVMVMVMMMVMVMGDISTRYKHSRQIRKVGIPRCRACRSAYCSLPIQ